MSKDTIDESRFGRFAKRIGTKLQFWSRQKRARAQVLKITKNLFAEFDRFMGRRQEKFKNVSWDTLWKFMISTNGMALPHQYAASLLKNQKTRSTIFAEWDKVKTSSGIGNPAASAKENWNIFLNEQDLNYPIGGDSNNNVSATLAELAVTYIFEMGAIRYIESKGQKKDKRFDNYDTFDHESLANLDINRMNRRELVNVLQSVKKGKRFDDYDSFDQESLANLDINRMSRMNRRELINVLRAVQQDMGILSKRRVRKAAKATTQQTKKSRSQATASAAKPSQPQATASAAKPSQPQATASATKPTQSGKPKRKPVSATFENSHIWATPELVKKLQDQLNQYKTKKAVPEHTILQEYAHPNVPPFVKDWEEKGKPTGKDLLGLMKTHKINELLSTVSRGKTIAGTDILDKICKNLGMPAELAKIINGMVQNYFATKKNSNTTSQTTTSANAPQLLPKAGQTSSQSQTNTSTQKSKEPPFTSGIEVLDKISAEKWQKLTIDEWTEWYDRLIGAFDKQNKNQIENMKKMAAAIKANDDAAIDIIKNLIRDTKFNAINYRIVRNLLLTSKLADDVKKYYVKLLGEFPPKILSEREFISLSKMLLENKLTWKNLGYSSVYRNKDMGTVILFESSTSGGTSAGNIASIPNAGGPMMPVIRRMPPGQSFFAPQVAKRTKKKAKKSS